MCALPAGCTSPRPTGWPVAWVSVNAQPPALPRGRALPPWSKTGATGDGGVGDQVRHRRPRHHLWVWKKQWPAAYGAELARCTRVSAFDACNVAFVPAPRAARAGGRHRPAMNTGRLPICWFAGLRAAGPVRISGTPVLSPQVLDVGRAPPWPPPDRPPRSGYRCAPQYRPLPPAARGCPNNIAACRL